MIWSTKPLSDLMSVLPSAEMSSDPQSGTWMSLSLNSPLPLDPPLEGQVLVDEPSPYNFSTRITTASSGSPSAL